MWTNCLLRLPTKKILYILGLDNKEVYLIFLSTFYTKKFIKKVKTSDRVDQFFPYNIIAKDNNNLFTN